MTKAHCEHPMHDDDCPHGCEAPYVCAYCGEPAVTDRLNRESQFKESVCEQCGDDLDKADKHQRRRDDLECYGDYLYDRMKDEGY